MQLQEKIDLIKNNEIDFILRKASKITAIEVKTGYEYNDKPFEIFKKDYQLFFNGI